MQFGGWHGVEVRTILLDDSFFFHIENSKLIWVIIINKFNTWYVYVTQYVF